MVDWTIQPVGSSEDGYFIFNTITNTTELGPLQLFQLTADNQINNISSSPTALIGALLYSQPALRYDDPQHPIQVEAHEVESDKQVWTSDDDFLVGVEWGTNATFTHYSTAYQLVDSQPGLFFVLNTAYTDNVNSNKTVIAQAAIYQLSTGKQVSLSPLLSFEHLHHPDANPTTWQFDDVLLLRGDAVWYTLQLPALQLVQQGAYATADASLQSNNWIVDPDGSYVALLYGTSDEVSGYPPYVSDAVAVEESSAQAVGVQHRHVKRG